MSRLRIYDKRKAKRHIQSPLEKKKSSLSANPSITEEVIINY